MIVETFDTQTNTGTDVRYSKKVLKQLKENYLVAVALVKLIREQTDEIQTQILSEHVFNVCDEFKDDETPNRITRPEDTFMMCNDDMTRFLTLLKPEYEKAGIASKRGMEYIPASDAMDLERAADEALVEYALQIIPIKLSKQLKAQIHRKKVHDGVLNTILLLEC